MLNDAGVGTEMIRMMSDYVKSLCKNVGSWRKALGYPLQISY